MARLNLILMNVTLATLAIALFQRLTGVSPLILFVVPPAELNRSASEDAEAAAAHLGRVLCEKSIMTRRTFFAMLAALCEPSVEE